jgi:hypothetical protein
MASAKPKGKPSAPIKSNARSPAEVVERVVAILEEARARVARTVNSTHVVANWLVREIVEGEQAGARGAGLNSETLSRNSARSAHSKGAFWPRTLATKIHHAARDEFPQVPSHFSAQSQPPRVAPRSWLP